MTKSFCHFDTIPSNMMDIIEEYLTDNFDGQMQPSRLMGNVEDTSRRSSKNAWVPTATWVGGVMWYYFKKANDEYFHYNLNLTLLFIIRLNFIKFIRSKKKIHCAFCLFLINNTHCYTDMD